MEERLEEGKPENAKDIVKNIVENYINVEKSIINQLRLYNELHPLTTGVSREDIWLQLFQMIVPKKFVIEHSVFIIDSYSHVSKEVDLAIIDNMYTPYIFHYGKLKFIPIEAVAAVIECKSSSVSFSEKSETSKDAEKSSKSISSLDGWCDSIKELHTSQESIVRMATSVIMNGALMENANQKEDKTQTVDPQKPAAASAKKPSSSTQTATRPIRIFCGYETKVSIERLENLFDFILMAKDERIELYTKKRELVGWYMELNHYQKKEDDPRVTKYNNFEDYELNELKVENKAQEVPLLTFNFQLNQLLMLINNPIPFPHRAYAKMFNENIL